MTSYRKMGAFAALAALAPTLGACAQGAYGAARIEAPPQPGMKERCFTPPNPGGRSIGPPARCWWYWPKNPATK